MRASATEGGDLALEASGYPELRAEQEARHEAVRQELGESRSEVADALARLDAQKEKVAAVTKDYESKMGELFAGMRSASDEQRSEMFSKLRGLRADADKKALGVLTDEQARQLEKNSDAARIVVRAVVHEITACADVVVVGRDQDVLVSQLGIRSPKHTHQVGFEE